MLFLRQGDIVLFKNPNCHIRPGIVLKDSHPKDNLVHIVSLTSAAPPQRHPSLFLVEDYKLGLQGLFWINYRLSYTVEKKAVLKRIGNLSKQELFRFAKEYSWYLFPFLKDAVISRLDIAIRELDSLLTRSPDEIEAKFHDLLATYPILLDPIGEVHSKPLFIYPPGYSSPTGKKKLQPDFIISYSVQHYRLVEIERPNKKTVTDQGHQRATVTQAAYQLSEWEHFLEHHSKEVEHIFPGIGSRPNRSYTLIIGRNSDIGPYKNIDDLRTQLKRAIGEEVLTYDDLLIQAKDFYENLNRMSLD